MCFPTHEHIEGGLEEAGWDIDNPSARSNYIEYLRKVRWACSTAGRREYFHKLHLDDMEKKHEEKRRKIEDQTNGAPEPKRISIKQVLSELRDLHNDVSEMKAQLSLHQEKIKKLEAQFRPPQKKITPAPVERLTPGSLSLDWEESYCSRCDSFGHSESTH